jgi:hypothetical protein
MKSEKPKTTQIWLSVRITNSQNQYLNQLLKKSTYCRNMSEVIRDMLFKRKITVNTYDASLDSIEERLALIKNEIRVKGININQITRYFNSTSNPEEKLLYAEKVAENYREVGDKVQDMFELLNQIARHFRSH